MKYFSDKTNRLYETEEECRKAENEFASREEEKRKKEESDLAELELCRKRYLEAKKALAKAQEDNDKAYCAVREAALRYYNRYGTIATPYREFLPFGNFFLPYI